VLANKNGNLLSVNSGEIKSITVALTKEENYYIQGSSAISATFKPLLDTGVSELESIISFDFDNTFSLSGVSENSEFINTFPSDTLKTVTYQYGIDAELISYDLYDLSKKIEELESKGNGETVDNSITDLGTVTSLDDDILKNVTTVGLYKFIWSPVNSEKYMCLMEISHFGSTRQTILTHSDSMPGDSSFIQYNRYY
jgi:hypothetical protein